MELKNEDDELLKPPATGMLVVTENMDGVNQIRGGLEWTRRLSVTYKNT